MRNAVVGRVPILQGCIGGLLAAVALFQLARISGHIGSDFKIFYEAALRFGRDPAQLYSPGSIDSLQGFLYPPPAILLFRGFALLDPASAYGLFLLIVYGATIAAALMWMAALEKDMRPVRFSGYDKAVGVLLAIAAGPVFSAASAGQVDTAVLCLCGLYALLLRKERFVAAGVVLSVGCWIKIYPVLLLIHVFARKGRLRLVAGFLLGFVLVPALLSAWIPWELYPEYFSEYLPHLSRKTIINIYNQSLSAFLMRMHVPVAQSLNSYDALPVSAAIRGAVAAAGAAFVLYAISFVRRENSRMVALALVLSAVCWLAPLGWGHAYVYSLPIVLLLWGYSKDGTAGPIAAVFGTAYAAMLLPVYHRFAWLSSLPDVLANAIYSRYLFLVLALVFAAAIHARTRLGRGGCA